MVEIWNSSVTLRFFCTTVFPIESLFIEVFLQNILKKLICFIFKSSMQRKQMCAGCISGQVILFTNAAFHQQWWRLIIS